MKRVFKIAIIVICLGLALVLFQIAFQIESDILRRRDCIWAAVLAFALLVNYLYAKPKLKKMKEASGLLEENPLEYICVMEDLLKTAKGETLRDALTLNLAAGYMESKQFDTAIHILEGFSDKRLMASSLKMVHRSNLFECYFETEQYEKAMALYDANQKLFARYRGGKAYGANIAIIDIRMAMRSGQYQQAEKLLSVAEKTYDNPRFQKEFYRIANILDEIENRQSES